MKATQYIFGISQLFLKYQKYISKLKVLWYNNTYNAKGLRGVEEGKIAPMPKFDSAIEMLDPMAVSEEAKENVVEKDEDDNAALLAKLLANPETAALIKALAKAM